MRSRCLIPILIVGVLFLSSQTSSGSEPDSVRCATGAEIYECARATRQVLADSSYHAARVEIIQVGIEEILLVERGARFRSDQLILLGINDSLVAVLPRERSNQQFLTRSFIDDLLNQIIARHAENGYPFAQLTVVGERLSADTLYLECRLLGGPHTRIGKIHYQGLETTRPTTLMRRHALRVGDWYRESELLAAAAALARVDFCRLSAEPSLRFDSHADLVDIIFVMQDKRSFLFNGALSLLPDGTLAGNLELRAQNLLGGGRKFEIGWDRKDADSRRLRLAMHFPYLAMLPLDLGVVLAQEERDSAFVTTSIGASLDYHAGSGWLTGLGVSWEKVTPPEGGQTPSARTYGVEISTNYDQRDNQRDPRAGVWLQFGLSSHYRKSFSAGDSLTGGYGSSIEADLRHWLRLVRQTSVFNRLRIFQVNSDFSPLPSDLLYAVGGSHGPRGYRERQFLADRGVIHTLELQWHPLPRLLLRLFVDNAYLSTPEEEFGLSGFGSGFSVDTNLGRIRFDLSLGEEKSLDKMFVHFGFESEW